MLKFKSVLSQLCGIFPYTCLQFAGGSALGYNVILIAELHKDDSEIPITMDQLTWFASLGILKPIGTIITGFLMHRLGSRPVALIAASTLITSCLLYHFSTTATIILLDGLLGALSDVNTIDTLYISEVSEPHLRGIFFAIAHLSSAFGSFFSLLMGSLLYWRTIALVNLTFPILAAVTVLATPNSPTWLASKGRFDEAEKALSWLRGWVPSNEVQSEFRALVYSVENSSSDERNHPTSWHARTKNFFRLFLQRSFYLPLLTMGTIFFLFHFGGVGVIGGYSTVIFRDMHSPIEESIATAIMGSMNVIGHIVILLSIHRVGKRRLAFFSLVVAGSCHAVTAVVGFLKLEGEFLWVPPIAMIVANFGNASGIGTVVFMLLSEIFPSHVRYIGTSIGFAISLIMSAVMSKLFLYLVDAITLYGVFLLFAVVNFVALIVYYFLFPETDGKSLKDIEDYFSASKHSTRYKRPEARV